MSRMKDLAIFIEDNRDLSDKEFCDKYNEDRKSDGLDPVNNDILLRFRKQHQ